MTTPSPRQPIDDAMLGRIVRETVDDWAMPSVRLDEPGWRERVRGGRAPRTADRLGRGLGRAIGGAVVLALGAVVVGTLLTQPRRPVTPGASTGPSPSASGGEPSPSGVAATPLPTVFLSGEMPDPSRVLVDVEDRHGVVDLEMGRLVEPQVSGAWGTALRVGPDGSLYCLCLTESDRVNDSPTRIEVTWQRFAADGSVEASTSIGVFAGAADPRDGFLPERPLHVSVKVTAGAGASIAWVGWAVRHHPVWRSGLIAIDVVSGDIVARVDLEPIGTGSGDERIVGEGPRVVGAIADGTLVVARSRYAFSPPTATDPIRRPGVDAYRLSFDGATAGTPESLPAAEGCADDLDAAGALPGGAAWLVCRDHDVGNLVVRRLGQDLAALGDTTLPAVPLGAELGTGTAAISSDGSYLLGWDPAGLRLTRVDLATGEIRSSEAPLPASASVSLLDRLGAWLVPSVAAKVLLAPGIALSPDGRRIYAVGLDLSRPVTDGLPGSTGIHVFDAVTLEALDVWTPTADFVSIAVSADGRFVYAAGGPRVDAAGRPTSQPASITVYDAADGSIRVIAGQLGMGLVLFSEPVLR